MEENKKVAPARNIFGEDNHEKIDIMIEVIEQELDEDDADDQFGDDETRLQAANDAIAYLNGESDIDDLLFEPRA